MLYKIVKSTYNNDLTCRVDSELITGGYDDKKQAFTDARKLIVGNELKENEFFEVEEHEDNGDLVCIIEP